MLVIGGLVPASTCDWPGRIVTTVFCQGCPWNCGYCHNPDLIDPRRPGAIAWETVRDLLRRRVGLLDGVVFSGGEPTRQPALPSAIRQVREAGFAVGLHTSGAHPRRLAQVLPSLDWVGLDIKALPRQYPAVTEVASSGATALESLRRVLAAGVPVQVRTTVDPTVMSDDDVQELSALLAEMGVIEHVLQEVRGVGARPQYRAALAAARPPAAG